MYIQHLKERLERNAYRVDADAVAAAIVRRLRERAPAGGPHDAREAARLLSGEVVEPK